MQKNTESAKLRYQKVLEWANTYKRDYDDDDYEIHIDSEKPRPNWEGYVKVRAVEFEMEDDGLLEAFTLASRVLILTKEVELSDGFEYVPEIVFTFAD